jgi:hypothetical protein
MIAFIRATFVTWCVLASAGFVWFVVWLLEKLG